MITIACVRTGDKYPPEYVERLYRGVRRHLPDETDFRFVCLIDQPMREIENVEFIDVSAYNLPGWWAKMALFDKDLRYDGERWAYLDLDMVACGDLSPFIDYDGPFAICENFTRLAGHSTWPCHYGSCAMSFPPDWGDFVFEDFMNEWLRPGYNQKNPYGDQYMIERAYPTAVYLQNVLPLGFFLNKRDLENHRFRKPDGAAIVVFGGQVQPDNCGVEWVRSAWMA